MANVELATAYVSLVPTMQGVQGKVAEALAPAGAEADKAGKSSGGMFAGGFAGALSAAAVGVAAGAAAVGGAAVGLYKVGAVFDDVTDTIRVGTGASGEALDGLVAIAQSVGASVPTSFEKAGQTVTDLNQRLGISGSTLNTVAQQYIQAGNILGTDVDITTTTAAFSAFGIEGANVEGAMDSLFRVAQATGVGMNELASTVQTNAVPMQNLGFSFADTAALAGSLDKAGLNTSQTMGAMGKSLITLAKAGEEPQAAFKRTTSEIGEFVKSGDTAGALNLASKVFGTKGASAFVGALQSGKINLDDLTASAGLSSDTILGLGQETADAAESWQLIKNKALLALEPMGTAVFNLAGQGLGFLASNMDGVIGKVATFSEGATGLITILATGDFKGNPFGLEEDSALIGFLFNVREAFQSILPIASQIMASVGPAFGALVPLAFQLFQALSPTSLIFQALLPVLPQLATAIGGLIEQVVPLVVSLAAQLIPIITQLVSSVLPPLTVIFSSIASAIAPLIMQIAETLIPVIQALMPVIVTVFSVVAAVITAAMQIIQGIIQVVTGIISGNWSQVWAGIGNIFGGIWSTIVAVVTGALQIVGQVVISGLGLVAGFVGGALGNIGRFFADTWANITSGVSGFIDGFMRFFTELPGKIQGALSGAGSWLLGVGKNIIDGLINGISGASRTVARAIANLVPEAIRGPIESALGIQSPSRVAMWWMEMIGAGFVKQAPAESRRMQSAMDGLVTVPTVPTYGSATAAGDYRTSGGFGQTYNIYETDDPIATAHSVARRQNALTP